MNCHELSKIVERIFETIEACGPNHFAYSKERGLRDALGFNLMSWILMFHSGHRVGLYCSDVSGAFDRVSAERLCTKLKASGIHQQVLDVIWSWLQKRKASIVVDGNMSDEFVLSNSVYQGTTWGPPLWNHYYADAKHAVHDANFIESISADVLNAFQGFKTSISDDQIQEQLEEC